VLITLEPGEFGLDGGGDGSESETSCTGRTGVRLTYSVSHVPVHSRTGGLGVSGSEHRSDQSENGHNPMTQSKLFRKGLSLISEYRSDQSEIQSENGHNPMTQSKLFRKGLSLISEHRSDQSEIQSENGHNPMTQSKLFRKGLSLISEYRSDQSEIQSENGHNPMTQSKLFRKGLSLISEHRSDQSEIQSEIGHNPMTQSKLFRKGLSLILESNRSTAFVGDQGIGIQPAEPPMLRHRRLKWFQKAYPPAEAKGTTFRRSCFTSGDVHLRDATQQEYASESFALRARKGAPSRHAA